MECGDVWIIRKAQDAQKVLIGCMKTHGTLEDILNMIEDGDQGKHLQERVYAIRQNSYRMQALKELWTDEEPTHLMDEYLSESEIPDQWLHHTKYVK
jgi:hypothetical protein